MILKEKELSEIISIYKKKEDNDSTLFLKLNLKIYNLNYQISKIK